MRIRTLVPLMLLASASFAFAGPAVKIVKTEKGEVIAGASGMTLYTFKKDKKGVSNCNGDCAKAWLPLMAKAGDKDDDDYSIIKRKDGTMQWAYYGKPLYYWIKDKKEGDVTGDGFKGVWNAARPE
ncbi:hypothetical protein JJB09_20495 [Rhizobium sp. KVB221]|uniref:Lipoprotein with Yx(FWY)xxD motif n=1 Tax=Rhizobium setariae TaxID=2801340 RepID=A0A936YVS8_9HYPH|nr:hypothetical protein [Rhizobium setariae]MBL0374397.1 hypothetical protein [Rhizobium setariae]